MSTIAAPPRCGLSARRAGWIAACLVGATLGCASPAAVVPNGTRLVASRSVGAPAAQEALPEQGAPPEVGAHLTLAAAEDAALRRHPLLRSAQRERDARLAEVRQASRRPNPTIGLEAEDFAGSGNLSGYAEAQTTLWIGQRFERGGKRSARVREAEVEVELAWMETELLAADIVARTRAAFVGTLAAQGELELALEAEGAAQQFHETVAERVAAGKASPIEETKSSVVFANARLERESVQHALGAARGALARTWDGEPTFGELRGELGGVRVPPTLDELRARLEGSPRFLRWQVERDQRAAVLSRERASARPDVTVQGGLRRIHGTDDTAAVLSLELPLALFDRRGGAIDAARARLARVEHQRGADLLDLHGELAGAWTRMTTAHGQVTALENEVLPDARSVFEAVDEGYTLGRFGLLDVLDAQRTLVLARTRHLRALSSYHQALVEIEALIGGPLL